MQNNDYNRVENRTRKTKVGCHSGVNLNRHKSKNSQLPFKQENSHLHPYTHNAFGVTCLEDDRVLLLRDCDRFHVGEDFSRPLASDWLRLSEGPCESMSDLRHRSLPGCAGCGEIILYYITNTIVCFQSVLLSTVHFPG